MTAVELKEKLTNGQWEYTPWPKSIIDISRFTKAKDDSRLYKTITNIVETLREHNFKDEEIEIFLLDTVKQIIKEV